MHCETHVQRRYASSKWRCVRRACGEAWRGIGVAKPHIAVQKSRVSPRTPRPVCRIRPEHHWNHQTRRIPARVQLWTLICGEHVYGYQLINRPIIVDVRTRAGGTVMEQLFNLCSPRSSIFHEQFFRVRLVSAYGLKSASAFASFLLLRRE